MSENPIELWKQFYHKYQELKAISNRIQVAESAQLTATSSPCIKCSKSSSKEFTYCPHCSHAKTL